MQYSLLFKSAIQLCNIFLISINESITKSMMYNIVPNQLANF